MLKEFFQSVTDFCTSQKAFAPVVLPVSRSKRVTMYWDPAEGEVKEVAHDRPDNRHELLSVESVVEYVQRSAGGGMTNVWVGDNSIVVECRENSPGDVLTMKLVFSPLFSLLQRLHKSPKVSQAEAIKLLRQQLAEFDPTHSALAAARSLKLTTGEEFDSDKSHVVDRLGKSIMKRASGAAELPEFIDVKTPVYLKGGQMGYVVRVWLSVDFDSPGHFRFEPDESHLENAIIAERLELVQLFRANLSVNVNVYEGRYNVER